MGQIEIGFLLALLLVCFVWAICVELRLNFLKDKFSKLIEVEDEKIKEDVHSMSDDNLSDAVKEILSSGGPK